MPSARLMLSTSQHHPRHDGPSPTSPLSSTSRFGTVNFALESPNAPEPVNRRESLQNPGRITIGTSRLRSTGTDLVQRLLCNAIRIAPTTHEDNVLAVTFRQVLPANLGDGIRVCAFCLDILLCRAAGDRAELILRGEMSVVVAWSAAASSLIGTFRCCVDVGTW